MNVYDATLNRIKLVFEDFDNVLVAFSTGKDSSTMLNMVYNYAKENDLLHKLSFYYQDYEANYKYTHELADRTFNKMKDVANRYWLCLPHSAACSVSMYEPKWIPWDDDKKDIWVRPMPKGEYVININNCPFDFVKGTSGFYTRIYFAKWFAKTYGNTAVLVGLRADESLTRRGIITSQHRRYMHKNLSWSKQVDQNTCNFYPMYDWKTSDIWVANYKYDFDYNKLYDLYYQAGLTPDQMRTASPFHQSGQDNLKLYRVIDPNNWGRMVGRVNGCNFGGIYGGTSAMAWRKVTKPIHFTWKEYAEFLIGTLPDITKKKFTYHLKRLQISWSEKGYGRNEEVIKQMKDEGILLEHTGIESKLCTKPKYYEIVKIKSGFPDETNIQNFRRCPSWKAVCMTILKNDWSLQYMGCSRTKEQVEKKKQAITKYKTL